MLPGIEDPGIPGRDFIPAEWVDACEIYGKWKIVKQEQPECIEKTARISPGLISNFGTSTYVLDVHAMLAKAFIDGQNWKEVE